MSNLASAVLYCGFAVRYLLMAPANHANKEVLWHRRRHHHHHLLNPANEISIHVIHSKYLCLANNPNSTPTSTNPVPTSQRIPSSRLRFPGEGFLRWWPFGGKCLFKFRSDPAWKMDNRRWIPAGRAAVIELSVAVAVMVIDRTPVTEIWLIIYTSNEHNTTVNISIWSTPMFVLL